MHTPLKPGSRIPIVARQAPHDSTAETCADQSKLVVLWICMWPGDASHHTCKHCSVRWFCHRFRHKFLVNQCESRCMERTTWCLCPVLCAPIVTSSSLVITFCGDMWSRNTREVSYRYVCDLEGNPKRLHHARQRRHSSRVISVHVHSRLTEHWNYIRTSCTRVCTSVARQWQRSSVPYLVSCQTVRQNFCDICDTVYHMCYIVP